ncbi:MAG: CGNR zinc finger domain-containing protein [Acidimicrobiia bacterium]|nr:CGNR zinc finger domain-containing protein [Acidimicrobiia bacterium]
MTDRDTKAPHDLEVVRRFINTLDVEDGVDLLEGIEESARWLREQGLLDNEDTFTANDAQKMTTFREALRGLLGARHSGSQLSPETVDRLDEVARAAGLTAQIHDQRWVLKSCSPGVDGALGKLVVIMLNAISDGTWDRLQVCENDRCQWAFYDHSRSHTGRWCSMSVCGNRAKQRAWRARQTNPST